MNQSIWSCMRNLLHGIGSSIEIAPSHAYVRPMRDGFRRDRAALRKDHTKVGDDVRRAIKAVNG